MTTTTVTVREQQRVNIRPKKHMVIAELQQRTFVVRIENTSRVNLTMPDGSVNDYKGLDYGPAVFELFINQYGEVAVLPGTP